MMRNQTKTICGRRVEWEMRFLDPCEIGAGSCRRRWYSERERSIAERWIFAEFGEDARKFSYRGACAYGIAQRTPASNIHRISDRIIFFFSSSFLSQNVVGFRGFRSLRSFRSSKPTSYPGLPSLPVTRGYQAYQFPAFQPTKPTNYPGFPSQCTSLRGTNYLLVLSNLVVLCAYLSFGGCHTSSLA